MGHSCFPFHLAASFILQHMSEHRETNLQLWMWTHFFLLHKTWVNVRVFSHMPSEVYWIWQYYQAGFYIRYLSTST